LLLDLRCPISRGRQGIQITSLGLDSRERFAERDPGTGLSGAEAGERLLHDVTDSRAERAARQMRLPIAEPAGVRALRLFERHVRFVILGFLLFSLLVGHAVVLLQPGKFVIVRATGHLKWPTDFHRERVYTPSGGSWVVETEKAAPRAK